MTENNEIISSRIVRKYNEGEYIFSRDDIGVLLARISELASDIVFRDNMRDQLINETGNEITRLRLLVAELKEDAKFWYGECQGVIPDEEIELHRSLMSKVDEITGN